MCEIRFLRERKSGLWQTQIPLIIGGLAQVELPPPPATLPRRHGLVRHRGRDGRRGLGVVIGHQVRLRLVERRGNRHTRLVFREVFHAAPEGPQSPDFRRVHQRESRT